MAAKSGPTVRRRRLAGELRRMRDRAELTLEQACERLGWSIAKLSRIETARQGVSTSDLEVMFKVYGIDEEEKRRSLLTLARRDRTKGWWDAYADALPSGYSNYIALEAEVEALRCYDVQIFHGLVQTDEYARQITRAGLMALKPPAEVERRVEARMTRQRLLTREENPVRLWDVIDEAVLHHIVGSPKVMRDQLQKILDLAELPNVKIQILPNSAGTHPATAGTLSIMEFPGSYEPDVVYVETMTANLYIEDDAEIYRHSLAFEHLLAMALDPEESKERIAQVADHLKE